MSLLFKVTNRVACPTITRHVGVASRCFASDSGDKGEIKHFAHPLEHATGEEKRWLMLQEKGITDPYHIAARSRGPGTKDKPNLVPSFEPKRLVGCVCEEDATSIMWMWVHKGDPKRCACGHWFKCVDAHDHFADAEKDLDERGMFHKQ